MEKTTMIDQIRKLSLPLQQGNDLDALIEAIGDAKIVLLGEASHGTSEFYTWRTELTKRLIASKGFSFIAVEGDFPACYNLNRYVKQYSDPQEKVEETMEAFKRWPSWMWANRETAALANWLRQHNETTKSNDRKVGFYGLDVYSLWESMEEIIKYLEKIGSPELEIAKRAFSCFEPYDGNEQEYGMAAAFFSDDCENEVVKLLHALSAKRSLAKMDPEAAFAAELNALAAVNAERYYRSMVRGGPGSWNIRDRHMVEVLNRLMAFHGSEAKAIVWEHNTHIGDARATDMVQDGMVNVGQLLREQNEAKKVFAIGFGTHRGTVIAAEAWGAPMKAMKVPAAIKWSWEDLFHQAGAHDQLFIFNQERMDPFGQILGHRAIGVVYDPQRERGNYVPTNLAQRYDAFIYVDESHALHPLALEPALSHSHL